MIPSIFSTAREFLGGDGALILPELELLLFACGIWLIDRWLAVNEKHWNAILALGGVAFSGFTLYVQHGKLAAQSLAHPNAPGLLGLHQSVLVDPFFLFFAVLLLAALALIVLVSIQDSAIRTGHSGAFYAFLLLACVGMLLIASSVNMAAILGGVELMSLSCFLLVKRGTGVAARNYAMAWVCSSVALAMGFSLLYGMFQTTNIGKIGAALEMRAENGVAFAGLATWQGWLALGLLAGGAFLLTEAAPLQWFAAGISEGAPTAVAAYLATAAKAAGIALLLRLFSFLFLFTQEKWIHVWGGVAFLSLIWGSVAAMREQNVKRLLAYGGVAHVGFILLGLVAANEGGIAGMFYYTGAMVFSLAGVFAVLVMAEQRGETISRLADLNGLTRRNRAAAILLVLFLLSLAGVPCTAGFLARFYIVKGLLAAPHPELAAFAVLCAAAATYYYVRIAMHAFKRPSASAATEKLEISSAQTVALTAAAFVTLAAGLYPEPFLRIARYAFGQ